MNRSFYFTFVTILIFSLKGIAQSQVLHGKVTNERDKEGIHILNTTSRFNAITNENGNFSIRVNREDTLVFSSVTYVTEKVIISEEINEKGILTIRLSELVNQLDEVILGPNLSGNIATDIQNIKTKKKLNFDDVGIPGFKEEGEEKIVPVAIAFFPLNVNLEAIYKHWTGYYRKLKIKREWEGQNNSVALIIHHYSEEFFKEAYGIPENRVYDFVLFCIETSTLQDDFKKEIFSEVLNIFKTKSEEYVARLMENEE
ncbi:MAG: hypothetical protein ACI9OS_000716 [Ulvibacter sp.]